jgi:hypothetical protein
MPRHLSESSMRKIETAVALSWARKVLMLMHASSEDETEALCHTATYVRVLQMEKSRNPNS